MKIDLHVHSKFSKRPSIWLLNKLGCPESYLEPVQVYHVLRRIGMTHVTITDHNAIGGCLEIAHLDNTFISEEVTTYFPEDKCKIHVLAWNITEGQHGEIQRLRENIYDLSHYLRENRIAHAVAHPLAAVNDRFRPEHFEKLLAMFQVLELNGDQERGLNDDLVRMAACLTKQQMLAMAQRHVLPEEETLWPKRFVAGSDDHAGIVLGSSFTTVAGADTLEEFFHGLRTGRAVNTVGHGSPRNMARNIHAVAYQYLKRKFKLEKSTGTDMLLRFLDGTLDPNFRESYGFVSRIAYALRRYRGSDAAPADDTATFSLSSFLRREGRKLILEDPQLVKMVESASDGHDLDGAKWFAFVNRISNRALRHLATNVFTCLRQGRLFDIFHSLGSAGSLYLALAPYFVAYPLFAKEKKLAEEVVRNSFPELNARRSREARVAYFTDTLFDTNGVTRTLRQFMACASATDKYMKVLTCHATHDDGQGYKVFRPIGEFGLDEYPGMNVYLPPFLEMLDYVYAKGFTHLHASTPGPVGLAALAAGRLLGKPVFSTYHTALARYVSVLTGDASMEEATWKYLAWFYNQCDMVLASTADSVEELAERGVERSRIRIFPRGVDTRVFHPVDMAAAQTEQPRFLYVGRVSLEKNLQTLARAFRLLQERFPEAELTVVGDGPYLRQMREDCAGLNVSFTGQVEWKDLPELYRNHGGVFVFPSMTDTFGNVVLEAQACGMPVLVSDTGGPRELVEDGRTGRIADCRTPASLAEAMSALSADAQGRASMAEAAVRYARTRDFRTAFARMWRQMYEAPRSDQAVSPEAMHEWLKRQAYSSLLEPALAL